MTDRNPQHSKINRAGAGSALTTTLYPGTPAHDIYQAFSLIRPEHVRIFAAAQTHEFKRAAAAGVGTTDSDISTSLAQKALLAYRAVELARMHASYYQKRGEPCPGPLLPLNPMRQEIAQSLAGIFTFKTVVEFMRDLNGRQIQKVDERGEVTEQIFEMVDAISTGKILSGELQFFGEHVPAMFVGKMMRELTTNRSLLSGEKRSLNTIVNLILIPLSEKPSLRRPFYSALNTMLSESDQGALMLTSVRSRLEDVNAQIRSERILPGIKVNRDDPNVPDADTLDAFQARVSTAVLGIHLGVCAGKITTDNILDSLRQNSWEAAVYLCCYASSDFLKDPNLEGWRPLVVRQIALAVNVVDRGLSAFSQEMPRANEEYYISAALLRNIFQDIQRPEAIMTARAFFESRGSRQLSQLFSLPIFRAGIDTELRSIDNLIDAGLSIPVVQRYFIAAAHFSHGVEILGQISRTFLSSQPTSKLDTEERVQILESLMWRTIGNPIALARAFYLFVQFEDRTRELSSAWKAQVTSFKKEGKPEEVDAIGQDYFENFLQPVLDTFPDQARSGRVGDWLRWVVSHSLQFSPPGTLRFLKDLFHGNARSLFLDTVLGNRDSAMAVPPTVEWSRYNEDVPRNVFPIEDPYTTAVESDLLPSSGYALQAPSSSAFVDKSPQTLFQANVFNAALKEPIRLVAHTIQAMVRQASEPTVVLERELERLKSHVLHRIELSSKENLREFMRSMDPAQFLMEECFYEWFKRPVKKVAADPEQRVPALIREYRHVLSVACAQYLGESGLKTKGETSENANISSSAELEDASPETKHYRKKITGLKEGSALQVGLDSMVRTDLTFQIEYLAELVTRGGHPIHMARIEILPKSAPPVSIGFEYVGACARMGTSTWRSVFFRDDAAVIGTQLVDIGSVSKLSSHAVSKQTESSKRDWLAFAAIWRCGDGLLVNNVHLLSNQRDRYKPHFGRPFSLFLDLYRRNELGFALDVHRLDTIPGQINIGTVMNDIEVARVVHEEQRDRESFLEPNGGFPEGYSDMSTQTQLLPPIALHRELSVSSVKSLQLLGDLLENRAIALGRGRT